MKIREKVSMDQAGLIKNGPITIVAFGDSITHGALGPGQFNYETVYWNRLRRKINEKYSYVPVNVINAGIGGITAKDSLGRMEGQVFSHDPDLVIVCFGLNDINGSLDDYVSSLRTIFERCNKQGCETIFMTPNMLNTYVADDTPEELKSYASKTAQFQTGGKMDEFMCSAVRTAEDCGINVCDCYSEWKQLAKTKDTTMLLTNRINHPESSMHELFAKCLFEKLFC